MTTKNGNTMSDPRTLPWGDDEKLKVFRIYFKQNIKLINSAISFDFDIYMIKTYQQKLGPGPEKNTHPHPRSA